MRQRIAVFVGLIVVCAVSWFLVQTSATFGDCVERAQYKSSQTPPFQKPSSVPVTLLMREQCLGTFVDENANGIIALFTIILAGSTIGLWFSTSKLWNSAERQLIATQRPWVKVNTIALASDLVFENGEATLTLSVAVGNYGNSPGLRVRIDAGIIASNERNIFQAQRDFAGQFRQSPEADVPELTSWRGDVIAMPVIARMDATELRRCQGIAARSDFPVLRLSIIGCITYEFDFADGWHQTGLLYMLRKWSPYPGALLQDQIANAQGAVRPEGRISEQDLAIAIGLEGTGPVD